MANTYYPRMAALLRVPTMGSARERAEQVHNRTTVDIPVKIRKCRLESNNHNEADALDITIDWADAGIDPRTLANAVIYFFLGQADSNGTFDIRPDPVNGNLRFIGIATDIERSADEESGRIVNMKFLDYTTLFIRNLYPADKSPAYKQNLLDAWNLICDNTGPFDFETRTRLSSVEAFKGLGNIVFLGEHAKFAADGPLGRAVVSRFANLAKVPIKHGVNSWDVWQQCVGSLGLFSYIYLDKCIVTDSSTYFTESNPPTLVWGRNIHKISERRDANVANKGVCLTSFNPEDNRVIEAYWPPRDIDLGVGKRIIAESRGSIKSTKQRAGNVPRPQKLKTFNNYNISKEYEFYEYPMGVSDQKTLDACAERVWEERSREEMVGKLITYEMSISRADKSDFDIISLRSGDMIRVEFEQNIINDLMGYDSDQEKSKYLINKGYSPQVAALMVRNMAEFGRLPPLYNVKSAITTLETDEDSGTFEVEVNYHNRIQESHTPNTSTVID